MNIMNLILYQRLHAKKDHRSKGPHILLFLCLTYGFYVIGAPCQSLCVGEICSSRLTYTSDICYLAGPRLHTFHRPLPPSLPFPSSPLPLTFLFRPLPFHFLPSLLLEVGPLNVARRFGGAVSSSSAVWCRGQAESRFGAFKA